MQITKERIYLYMKKIVALLITLVLLTGCTAKKQNETENTMILNLPLTIVEIGGSLTYEYELALPVKSIQLTATSGEFDAKLKDVSEGAAVVYDNTKNELGSMFKFEDKNKYKVIELEYIKPNPSPLGRYILNGYTGYITVELDSSELQPGYETADITTKKVKICTINQYTGEGNS